MKTFMTVNILEKAGAERVSTLSPVLGRGYSRVALDPTSHDMATPGFYFLVHSVSGLVHARFFVGNTRSRTGFNNVVSMINRRYSTPMTQLLGKTFAVYFIAHDKMKPLTTGWGKGQIAMAFTRSHNSDAQTLSELNRMLNDNFIFVVQKY